MIIGSTPVRVPGKFSSIIEVQHEDGADFWVSDSSSVAVGNGLHIREHQTYTEPRTGRHVWVVSEGTTTINIKEG